MHQQSGLVDVGAASSSSPALEDRRAPPTHVSRRWLLQSLPSVAAGIGALVVLAACGGEDDEDEGDDG